MLAYIIRRLLLMIPTVLGITFMVFMIIALSPGGLTAGLDQSGGGGQEGGAKEQQAYLEDRYGLNEPAPVQYLKWLGRISPVKFGIRNQRNTDGELLSLPRELSVPDAIESGWLGDITETPEVAEGEDAQPPVVIAILEEAQASPVPGELRSQDRKEDLRQYYRDAASAYANARGGFIQARVQLEYAIIEFIDENEKAINKPYYDAREAGVSDRPARNTELDGVLTLSKDKVLWSKLVDKVDFDYENHTGQEAVMEAAAKAVRNYNEALQARQVEYEAFLARPFDQAGFGTDVISIAMPDFGKSFSQDRQVLRLIGEAIPISLMLNIVVIPIIYIVAIPSGMLAAVRQGKLVDYGLGVVYIAGWSIPVAGVAVLCLGYFGNKDFMESFGLTAFPLSGLHSTGSEAFTWLPNTNAAGQWHRGYLLDTLWHMVLPIFCMSYGGFAMLSKHTRAAMLENFNADYVRTAKAKGVTPFDVTFRHVFRNSLLPLITMFVGIFPALLSGSVIIEQVFSIDGMGKLGFDAAISKDRELMLAVTLMFTLINLIALLLADILYAIADPRISYD